MIGSGTLSGDNPARAQQGKAIITYLPGSTVGQQIIIAESSGLIPDSVMIEVDNRLLVDDFENYESEDELSLVWQGYPGLTSDLFLNDNNVTTGNWNLSYSYRVGAGSPPYSWIFRKLDFDLNKISHLGFWFKPDSSSREFVIRLEEGSVRDWDYSYIMHNSNPVNMLLDLKEFVANDGSEEMDIQSISRLSFFVLPGEGGFGAGTVYFDEISFLSNPATAINDEIVVHHPVEFQLAQNFPNPFNPRTKISFFLPRTAKVKLSIFDILGRQVEQIFKCKKTAGIHEIEFNGSALASGIYIYSIEAGEWRNSRKMLLLK